MNKICTIQPEQWKNLGSVLKPINNQGSINIRSSGIYQDINNGVAILMANVASLIGDDIDLDIMNPNKHIKLFKLLESDDLDVDIYDDDQNSQYIATNGKVRIFLPKQIASVSPEENKPSYDGFVKYGEDITLDKDNKKEIEIIMKADSTIDSIDLLLKDGQLMGFEVKETGVYLFPDYTDQTTLNSQTCDKVLKSFAFMNIPGEEFELMLGQYTGEDRYALLTNIKTGFSVITLHEELEENNGDNILDLI